MQTLKTSTRAALALLALTLSLTACGTAPTETPPDVGTTVHDAAPPPATLVVPLTMGAQPVTAPDLIADVGDGNYRLNPTYETCTSGVPSCATWTATLPALPGYRLTVEAHVPMARVSGNSVVTVDQRDGQTTCEEPMQVWTFYQTSGERLPLPLDPVAVEPGPLTVGVCFSGATYARLGTPSVVATLTR